MRSLYLPFVFVCVIHTCVFHGLSTEVRKQLSRAESFFLLWLPKIEFGHQSCMIFLILLMVFV